MGPIVAGNAKEKTCLEAQITRDQYSGKRDRHSAMINDDPQTPARRLIERFGAQTLADWSGRHISRVYAWAWPPSRGGTGGFIPVRSRSKIVAGALKDQGVVLDWFEFEPQPGEAYALSEAA
jgi:hypothetical protein